MGVVSSGKSWSEGTQQVSCGSVVANQRPKNAPNRQEGVYDPHLVPRLRLGTHGLAGSAGASRGGASGQWVTGRSPVTRHQSRHQTPAGPVAALPLTAGAAWPRIPSLGILEFRFRQTIVRRPLKIMLWVGLAAAALLAVMALVLYRGTQHVPEFYQQALTSAVPTAPQIQVGDEFERQALNLHNQATKPGPWQAEFTDEQINAWLAAILPRNHPQALPAETRDPRVKITERGVQVGWRYQTERFQTGEEPADIGIHPCNHRGMPFLRIGPVLARILPVGRHLHAVGLGLVVRMRDCVGQVEMTPDEEKEIKVTLGPIYDLIEDKYKKEGKKMMIPKVVGCDKCNNTGYMGRVAIYEVMPISEKISKLVIEKAAASEIQKQAMDEGMLTMKQDGYVKVLEGVTTLDEVVRVAQY